MSIIRQITSPVYNIPRSALYSAAAFLMSLERAYPDRLGAMVYRRLEDSAQDSLQYRVDTCDDILNGYREYLLHEVGIPTVEQVEEFHEWKILEALLDAETPQNKRAFLTEVIREVEALGYEYNYAAGVLANMRIN